jgi:hypothetical protein
MSDCAATVIGPKYKWEENIQVDLKDTDWEVVEWINNTRYEALEWGSGLVTRQHTII